MTDVPRTYPFNRDPEPPVDPQVKTYFEAVEAFRRASPLRQMWDGSAFDAVSLLRKRGPDALESVTVPPKSDIAIAVDRLTDLLQRGLPAALQQDILRVAYETGRNFRLGSSS